MKKIFILIDISVMNLVCDDMMNTSSYSSPIFLETSPVVYPKQLFNTPAKTSPIKTQIEGLLQFPGF